MYLNSEANISILRTVKIKYVFLFPSQNKQKTFSSRDFVVASEPF